MSTPTGKALARTGLTIGLGAAFGTPGYIIGGVLGTVLFPPDPPEAPDPYTELQFNTAQEGISEPMVFGTVRIPGNFIFRGALRAHAISEGGKGGQKQVVGYTYDTDAAIGVCRGPVDLTRMWRNDEHFYWEGEGAFTWHNGTADQAVDADWNLLADQVVPLRRHAYDMYMQFPLGESASFPTMMHELHRYPYTTAMDTSPQIYNKVQESAGAGGVTMKDKNGDLIVFNGEGTPDTVRIYDKDFVLLRTIDVSSLNITSEWDATLTYTNGATVVNLCYIRPGSSSNQKIVITRFRTGIPALVSGSGGTRVTNYHSTDLIDNVNVDNLHITSNSDFLFIANSGTDDVYKTAAGAPQTILATYDMTAQGIFSMRDITCNADYFFVLDPSHVIYMWTVGGVYKDSEGSGLAGSAQAIVALYGGPYVIMYEFGEQVDAAEWEDTIAFFAYSTTSELFLTQSVPNLDVDGYWASGATPFRDSAMLKWSLYEGPEGTVLASGVQAGAQYTLQLIVDANPAQIIYSLFDETEGVPVARVNATALAALGQTCVANRIGMSFALNRAKNLGAILRDVLGHLQGQCFRDNGGKFSFYMPDESDTPGTDPITIADVQAIKNSGAPDMRVITTTLKDPELLPNRIQIHYTNRLDNYKKNASFPLDDMLGLDQDGVPIQDTVQYQMFSNPFTAAKMAWRAWKTSRYQNRLHTIELNGRWLWIQIGEVYNLNFPAENINTQRARVFSIDDTPLDTGASLKATFQMDDTYLLSYDAIDFEASLAKDLDVGPPVQVQPVFWEEPARHNADEYTFAVTAVRTDESTAYCEVHLSVDAPDNFFYAGRLRQFANAADLQTTVDEEGTEFKINTDQYEGSAFSSYSVDNALNGLSYCLVGKLQGGALKAELDELEFVLYEGTRVAGADLILENVHRGIDYTLGKGHNTASVVLHIGRAYFRRSFPSTEIGKVYYIKLQPVNAKGTALPLDEVETYEYTVRGFTRKAVHVSMLEPVIGTTGIGGRTKVPTGNVKVKWEKSNRNHGMGSMTYGEWEWDGFIDGDADDHDAIIYQSDGETVQATHEGLGAVSDYTYTNAQNTTDFGGSPSDDFWIGIRPTVTGRGVGSGRGMPDVRKAHIIRV